MCFYGCSLPDVKEHNDAWQREAALYTAQHVHGKKKRFEKFIADETLDRIRRSAVLNHTLVGMGGKRETKDKKTGEVKVIWKTNPCCVVC
jgi:hypothetical protein